MIITILKRLSKILSLGIVNYKFFFLSIKVAFHYLYVQIFIKKRISIKYKTKKLQFLKKCKNLNFQQRDFFVNNINSWLFIFDKYDLFNKSLTALEIGSYEGRSSLFLLSFLNKIKLTCVDTFKPSIELREYNEKKFHKIYKNFKSNTAKYSKKLIVIKNTSAFFFKKNKKKYDLIYVDGSHEYKDVVHDAKKAFFYLNNNGIIIFDDFLWNINTKKKLPINALIEFLHKYANNIELLHVDYQLIIRKIKI